MVNDLYNALINHKYPLYLIFFITERCNAKCQHCFVDFKKEKKELSLEQIEKIASTSGKCLRNVGITGGEPFLREDIFEIVDIWFSNSTITSLSLTTNGSMPEKIEIFCKKSFQKKYPIAFLMSYDFIGEKHSEYRKLKNLHENVYESFKIIKSFGNNLNVTFQITLTPQNVDTALETYLYIRDVLKIPNINITMVRGDCVDNIDEKTRKKMADCYLKLQQLRTSDFDNFNIKGFNNLSITEKILNAKNKIQWKYVLKSFVEKQYISPCSAGDLFGVIRADGNVTPCEIIETPIANLKDFDYDFMKLWSSKKAKAVKCDILKSKCCCTFEPAWFVNIISSPQYYPSLLFYLCKNIFRK